MLRNQAVSTVLQENLAQSKVKAMRVHVSLVQMDHSVNQDKLTALHAHLDHQHHYCKTAVSVSQVFLEMIPYQSIGRQATPFVYPVHVERTGVIKYHCFP